MHIIKSIAAASCLSLLAGGVAFAQTQSQSAVLGNVVEYPNNRLWWCGCSDAAAGKAIRRIKSGYATCGSSVLCRSCGA